MPASVTAFFGSQSHACAYGAQAYALCAHAYGVLHPPAELHLAASLAAHAMLLATAASQCTLSGISRPAYRYIHHQELRTASVRSSPTRVPGVASPQPTSPPTW